VNYFDHPEFHGHEHVSFFCDAASGLKAIIAIHDTSMCEVSGGGIRMKAYADDEQALCDVLRLSRGMTYKSALAGLPLGGAKSVIIGDPRTDKSPQLWAAMGRAINALGGRYIAGEDVGTTSADMDSIARVTPYVESSKGPNTAPFTALGVFLAMQVAVRERLGRASLDGVSVALQGVGKVASRLAALLVNAGARVYAADVNRPALDAVIDELGITPIPVDEIMELEVDVFSPCALGAILNNETIPALRAAIVCGAANNQLATAADDALLREHGILYMPDYLVNAGGVIAAACDKFEGVSDEKALADRVGRIATVAEDVIRTAKERECGMQAAADTLADRILGDARARQERS